jgi:hypothetical protein
VAAARAHTSHASLLAQGLAKAHAITVAMLDSKKPLAQPLVLKRWLLHGCDVLSAYVSTAVLAAIPGDLPSSATNADIKKTKKVQLLALIENCT